MFTYHKPSEDVWQWSVLNLDDSTLVDIENLFIPNTGRVFSFKEVGTYQVNVVNAKNGKYECVVNVANTGKIVLPQLIFSSWINGLLFFEKKYLFFFIIIYGIKDFMKEQSSNIFKTKIP